MARIVRAILFRFCILGAVTCVSGAFSPDARAEGKPPVVVIFVLDGLQDDAAVTAAANGAENLRYLIDNGVRVKEALSTSPAPRMYLPDKSLPWGTTTSPNVAMHTGTHVFESRNMDDIFLAAKKAGIVSVFAGGADNYKEFTTAGFLHYGDLSDSTVVALGIEHFKQDGARLLRLHLQQIRDSWTGPADKTVPHSSYQRAICHADSLLGVLISTLKTAGVWDVTYLVVTSDHGMGKTARSDHPASIRSSWEPFMLFFGPGIKKGAVIPYAETPDIAIMTNHFLGLPPLAGHLDTMVTVQPKGATGTFLADIFEGGPDTLDHPRYIRRYLDRDGDSLSDDYVDYHLGMIEILRENATPRR